MKPSSEKKDLLSTIIEAADEKKAYDITVIDLKKFDQRITDYFVICHADTNVHLESIVQNIEVKTKKLLNEVPFSIEGLQNAYWIILDYINIVVHVMQSEARQYYELEKLWADAEIYKITEISL